MGPQSRALGGIPGAKQVERDYAWSIAVMGDRNPNLKR